MSTLKRTGCCLACGGQLTAGNKSPANPSFHRVCMDDGVDVPLEPGKYTDEELAGTWAEDRWKEGRRP